MDLWSRLHPVNKKTLAFSKLQSSDWGKNSALNTGTVPKLQKVKTALIGIKSNTDKVSPADPVRYELYRLKHPSLAGSTADLGDFRYEAGNPDDLNQLSELLTELMIRGIVPVIAGRSQELTIAQMQALEKTGRPLNLVNIDPRLDFVRGNPKKTDAGNFLNTVLKGGSKSPVHYTGLGIQTHYIDPALQTKIENQYGELIRIGQIRNDINETEPWIRRATFVSTDLSSVRRSDAPETLDPNPAGLYSEEYCRMMRFAGMNENCYSLGIYQWDLSRINDSTTARLISQGIWYFAEGVLSRIKEAPLDSPDSFYKYVVGFRKNEFTVNFYKSKRTGRWWLEMPPGHEANGQGEPLIPCSYADYQMACKDEIPERCLKQLEVSK